MKLQVYFHFCYELDCKTSASPRSILHQMVPLETVIKNKMDKPHKGDTSALFCFPTVFIIFTRENMDSLSWSGQVYVSFLFLWEPSGNVSHGC